jgi:hypothetical protein
MLVSLLVVMEGWGTKEEVTRGGALGGRLKACDEGWPGRGRAEVRRAFVTASLPLLIARHDVVEVREMSGGCERGRASDAAHSRVAVAVVARGLCGDGPELCWPAAGRDLRAGDAPGGVEGVKGGVDLAGGLVVMGPTSTPGPLQVATTSFDPRQRIHRRKCECGSGKGASVGCAGRVRCRRRRAD